MKRNATKRTEEWLTLAAAAEVAGVCIRTIQNWRDAGEIEWRPVRRGRVRSKEYLRASVEAFAAAAVEAE